MTGLNTIGFILWFVGHHTFGAGISINGLNMLLQG